MPTLDYSSGCIPQYATSPDASATQTIRATLLEISRAMGRVEGRLESLDGRIDTLEANSHCSKVRWGVLTAVCCGVCALAGGAASLLVTIGGPQVLHALALATGLAH